MKICPKCQIRYLKLPFKGYDKGVCWICFLKSKKKYKYAKKEIGGWFDWRTYIRKTIKVGWSFVETMKLKLLFGAILNCGSLNKTPKVPELIGKTEQEKLKLFRYSDWQIKICMDYYK